MLNPMRTFSLALLISALATAAAQSQDLGWHRYNLPDTVASVDVPGALLSVDAGPPDKGAGRMFRSADGSADLSVYALHNSGQAPAEFLRSHFQLPARAIVYQRVTDDMVTVSGFRGDKIWYARCNFATAELRCVSLNYPARDKRRWDPIVTRISHSLS
jgi:hypothetical protein